MTDQPQPVDLSLSEGHTPDPWIAYCMTVDGETPTAEQIGEYVKNSVIKSFEESGSMDFLFISASTPDGDRDICHIGNGPNGPRNAKLLADAPAMRAELVRLRAENARLRAALSQEVSE